MNADAKETQDKIIEILTVYLKDPDEYGDCGWKSAVLDVYSIALYDRTAYISSNTMEGLSYMAEVVYHMVCNKCGDSKVYDWFDRFAKAFVNGDDIPKFIHGACRIGKCKG